MTRKGMSNCRYWVKPSKFMHAEMCNWCFDNVGQPDNLFLGTIGQWSVNTKRGIFFFNLKEHQDAFIKDWNKL